MKLFTVYGMVSVYFSLVPISMGSPVSQLRVDSRHRHNQAEIRAVSVDRSGEAVDLREDRGQNQCVCHVEEPLHSSSTLAVLGDVCLCADNEAGVVKDRGCACTRTGSLDAATGTCVCEHARKRMRSLLHEQDRSASSTLKSSRKPDEVVTEANNDTRLLRPQVHPGDSEITQGNSSSVTSSNTFSVNIKNPEQNSKPVSSGTPNTIESADCAIWALKGECFSNPGYMQLHCAAACATIGRQQVKTAGTPMPTLFFPERIPAPRANAK